MSRQPYQETTNRVITQLPEDWHEERLYDIADLRTSNVDKKSEEGERSVQLCNYTDVYYNRRITNDLDFMEATATESQIERFGLRPGDVVITKDSETPDDIGVPALIDDYVPNLVCGYHLTILRPIEDVVVGSYLLYALISKLSAYQFYLAANGVTRFGLTYQGTKNIRVALPAIDEQRQIASFLDWKTGQVDALIVKKRELVEKLKEKRIAVITQAVTKGLSINAPMRESGMDWIGRVPKHWAVNRAKYVCEAIVDCKNRTPDYFDDGEFFVIRTTDVKNGVLNLEEALTTDVDNFVEWTLRGAPKRNDVLFTREAPAGEAALFDGLAQICMGQRMMYFRVDPGKLHPKYLLYYIYSKSMRTYIDSESGGSTVSHLRLGQVYNLPILQPLLIEQLEIVDYLDSTTDKIDLLIKKAESAIASLTEYRTVLITSATTGEIDVRGIKVEPVA